MEEEDQIDLDALYQSRRCRDCLNSILFQEERLDDLLNYYCCASPGQRIPVDGDAFCPYYQQGGSRLLSARRKLEANGKVLESDSALERCI